MQMNMYNMCVSLDCASDAENKDKICDQVCLVFMSMRTHTIELYNNEPSKLSHMI